MRQARLSLFALRFAGLLLVEKEGRDNHGTQVYEFSTFKGTQKLGSLHNF